MPILGVVSVVAGVRWLRGSDNLLVNNAMKS
jgi:hypothetical protein